MFFARIVSVWPSIERDVVSWVCSRDFFGSRGASSSIMNGWCLIRWWENSTIVVVVVVVVVSIYRLMWAARAYADSCYVYTDVKTPNRTREAYLCVELR